MLSFCLALGCFPQDGQERALPVAVIDTSTLEIIDRWPAPVLTFDVALDDETGKLWAVSESRIKAPRIWELSRGNLPVLHHSLSLDFNVVHKGFAIDYGAIAIDSTARRGAFTSPRSSELALIDLDTGEVVRRILSDYTPHGTAFDVRRGIGYSSRGLPYAFRTSDGEILGYNLCPIMGGPPLVVSSSGLLYAPALHLWEGDFLCVFDPDQGATSVELRCDDAYCQPVSIALSGDESRIFMAMPLMARIHVRELATGWESWVDDLSGPHGLEMSPDGSRLYVAPVACRRITVYDASSSNPVHLYDIELDGEPLGMDLSADGSRLYVAQTDPKGALGRGRDYLEEDGNDSFVGCPPLVPPP